MKENVFLIAKHLHIVGLEFFNSGICQRVMCHLLQDFIRHGGDIRTGQCAVGHMNRVAHAKSTTVDMNTAALQYFSQITRDLSPEQFHRLLNIIKEIVAECWVFVKQFSRNDTATACQDWLRVPGWAEEASSPMSAPSRCWHGAFCISGVCTPLSRCNTLDFVPKSCAKGCCAPWNPCSHRLWAMWIRRTESSPKGAPGCLRRGEGTSAEV